MHRIRGNSPTSPVSPVSPVSLVSPVSSVSSVSPSTRICNPFLNRPRVPGLFKSADVNIFVWKQQIETNRRGLTLRWDLMKSTVARKLSVTSWTEAHLIEKSLSRVNRRSSQMMGIYIYFCFKQGKRYLCIMYISIFI